MVYNWQKKDWPNFRYDLKKIEDVLFQFSEKAGCLSGMLKALPEDPKNEILIEIMLSEALKTSEIEGECLTRQDVMSSIKNNLGYNRNPEKVGDARAEGIGELMITVREDFLRPLSKVMLFSWHEKLMKGNSRIKSGVWRTHKEAMQVISGPIGKEKIHYEAPPSNRVPGEMREFIKWFNETAPGKKREIKRLPVRSAIAHLYFETIHPFEDGNGRIGRAISEKALSQEMQEPMLMSLSAAIEAKRNEYYDALKRTQSSNEVTEWIRYFTAMTLEAQEIAETQIEFTLKKTRLFDRVGDQINSRQLKVMRRMFAEGPTGFKGGMSAKKYISITGTTKATATRDLQNLVELGVLMPLGSGRSTHYELVLDL